MSRSYGDNFEWFLSLYLMQNVSSNHFSVYHANLNFFFASLHLSFRLLFNFIYDVSFFWHVTSPLSRLLEDQPRPFCLNQNLITPEFVFIFLINYFATNNLPPLELILNSRGWSLSSWMLRLCLF